MCSPSWPDLRSSLHYLAMETAHLAQALLLRGVGRVLISLVDFLEELPMLMALHEVFQSQHEEAAARDFHFAGKGFSLPKEGLLERDCRLDIHHLVIPC